MLTEQPYNALASLGKPTKTAVAIGHAILRRAAAEAKAKGHK